MDDYSKEILDTAKKIYEMPLLDVDDIPRIDLYMEQVTSFFDDALAGMRRREGDKILTKTMINNYTKYGILSHPNRKKYNKEHMISLIYVVLLKHILSIQDIKAFFDMLPSGEPDAEALAPIYTTYSSMVDSYRDTYAKELTALMDSIDSNLNKVGVDSDEARMVMLISLIATEATAHKLLAGRLIDQYMDKKKKEAEEKKAEQRKKEGKQEDKNKEKSK